MSLINDTLKDLEARWPQADAAANLADNSRDVSLEGASALTDRGKPQSGRWYLVGSGIAVFLLLVWFGKFYSADVSAPSTADIVTSEPVESHLVETALPAVNLEATTVGSSQLPTSTPLPGSTQHQQGGKARPLNDGASVPPQYQRLQQLLQMGERALARDRLTMPRNDNAHDHFLASLVLDPDNAEAKDGLRRVGERYLQLIRVAVTENRSQDVERLARRAEEVGVGKDRVQQLLAALTPTPPVPEPPAADMVRESETSRDDRIARQARNLISQGKRKQAQVLLVSHVTNNPRSVSSMEELFKLYLSGGELPEAEALLDHAEYLPPTSRALMQAQLHTHSGDYSAALSMLDRHEQGAQTPEAYLALRAGLLHKLQRHDEAASEYRRLLAAKPTNATYWLGLAVALDADRDNGALAAFERVLQFADGGENYLDYVRERVDTLGHRYRGS